LKWQVSDTTNSTLSPGVGEQVDPLWKPTRFLHINLNRCLLINGQICDLILSTSTTSFSNYWDLLVMKWVHLQVLVAKLVCKKILLSNDKHKPAFQQQVVRCNSLKDNQYSSLQCSDFVIVTLFPVSNLWHPDHSEWLTNRIWECFHPTRLQYLLKHNMGGVRCYWILSCVVLDSRLFLCWRFLWITAFSNRKKRILV
jgi:hypothetical protein